MKSVRIKGLGRSFVVTFCGFVALNSPFTFAQSARHGGGSTGGGDTCEREVQIIRDDIKNWISRGGPQIRGMQVQNNNYNHYTAQMLQALNTPATIECVKAGRGDANPVKVHGVAKTCKFLSGQQGLRFICDMDKFKSDTEDERYVMIHHEYAGYAGLEEPDGPRSRYHLSNQISASLENVMVKRLSVKPVTSQVPMTTMLSETDFVMKYQGLLTQKITELIVKEINIKPTQSNGGKDLLDIVEPNSLKVVIVDSLFGEYRYKWTGSKKMNVVEGPHFALAMTLYFTSKNGTPLYCNFTVWSFAEAKFDSLGNWTGEYVVRLKDNAACLLKNLNTDNIIKDRETEKHRQSVMRDFTTHLNVTVRP